MAADGDQPSNVPHEVVIKSFSTREAAAITVAHLESNGIACRIAVDDCAGLLPNLAMASGVRVLVPEAEAKAARDLLGLPEPDPSSKPEVAGSVISRISPVQIVLGIAIGALVMWALQNPVPQASSRPRTTHYHHTDSGAVDEEWTYRNGSLVCHKIDRNLDGRFDHWAYYDADGNVERSDEDNNFDGTPDEFWKYANNQVVSMEKDSDFNGVVDEFCTYKFRVVQQVDMRPNGSKFSTMREFLSNGVVTEIWTGGDSNGNFKEKVAYDPFFNPVHTNIIYQPLLSVP